MYLICRILLNNTMYASTRAYRICRMYGCDSGYFYAAKCLMSETPLRATTIMFIISLIMFGHMLRVCEE